MLAITPIITPKKLEDEMDLYVEMFFEMRNGANKVPPPIPTKTEIVLKITAADWLDNFL